MRTGAKDDRVSTALYSAVSAMKEYRLSPLEWSRLPRIDKKILQFARIVEVYNIEFSPERIKFRQDSKEAEQKRKHADLVAKMPKTLPMRRR